MRASAFSATLLLVGPALAQTPAPRPAGSESTDAAPLPAQGEPAEGEPADAAPPARPPAAPTAQPSPPAYEAPPPPERARGVHLHDGFYLRLSLGPGYSAFDGKIGAEDSKFEGSGFAVTGTIMIGGTPARGLVVGGATEGYTLPRPKFEAGSYVQGRPVTSLGLLYGFLDYFPNPHRGWHFGGGAGLASFLYREGASDTRTVPTVFGVGAAAWVGYDAWVGKQWSLGVETRALGAHVGNGGEDGPARSVNAFGSALLITALYHLEGCSIGLRTPSGPPELALRAQTAGHPPAGRTQPDRAAL